MTADDDHETETGPRGPRAHDIGTGGVVSITVDADDVRVRGVDGTEARVVSPADGAGIETTAEPGRFSVRTARHVGVDKAGFVGIQIGTRGFGMPLRLRISGTVEVEVPRDARVIVTSTAGDVAVRDVLGGASLKTTSGDISVKRAAGSMTAETASGDVSLAATEPIALEVRAVSGDVQARAPRFERVAIETISGDVELGGRFAAGVPHTVSTVSGDVDVALAGGLTLAVRTVSGSIDCEHPDRRDGDGRRRPLVIGDGAAQLSVRTMSGDVEVRAGRAGRPPATPADADGAAAAPSGSLPVPPPAAPAPRSPAPAAPPPAPGAAAPPPGAVARPGRRAFSTEKTQVAPAAAAPRRARHDHPCRPRGARPRRDRRGGGRAPPRRDPGGGRRRVGGGGPRWVTPSTTSSASWPTVA